MHTCKVHIRVETGPGQSSYQGQMGHFSADYVGSGLKSGLVILSNN